jgi:hypothetical protein
MVALRFAFAVLLLPGLAYAQPKVPLEVVSVVSGGHWQEGARSGTYRVVTTREGWEHLWSRLAVEWLADPGSRDEQQSIVASIEPELPSGQGTHVLEVRLTYDPVHGTIGHVTASNNHDMKAKPMMFRLKLLGPGQVKVIGTGARR